MKTKLLKTVKLPATKGKDIISNSKLFYWIDPDFKNWDLNKKSKDTKQISVEVQELVKDITFKEIFTEPEKMCLKQSQILSFIKNHKDSLRQEGYATFFLFKSNNQFFVASVHVDSDGLFVPVRRLGHAGVWHAGRRHRVVVPQLKLRNLDPLTPDSLNLETRIENLEEVVEKLRKFLII